MYRSAQHALKFIFRTLGRPIVKTSSPDGGGMGAGEMTQHDKHAEAAMMMSLIERAVDDYGMAYLFAHYGRELMGGEHERPVMDMLLKAVMAGLPTGMHSRRGVQKMVGIYFGKPYSMVSARKDLGCNNRRYYEYKEEISRILDHIGRRAENAVADALDRAGHIEKVEIAA